jgi:succinoglycan biosynthesis protein ExoA
VPAVRRDAEVQRASDGAGEGARPFVSVVIPVWNEERNITPLLQAIADQTYPLERLEILVCDGMSEDGTREAIDRFRREHVLPSIRVVDNPRRKQESALNVGIGEASGEFVVRLDGRSRPPKDYVERCVDVLLRTGAENVGGVQAARGDSPTQTAIALAMTHPFGVGNAPFRIGNYSGPAESVYLGCFRRTLFDRIGLFDEETPVISEDSDINKRIRDAGGTVFMDSSIEVGYIARENLASLWRLCFDYGRRRAGFMLKHRGFSAWRQLVPTAFVLTVAVLGVAAWFTVWAAIALVLVLGLYMIGAVASAVMTARRNPSPGLAGRMALAFPCMHVSYGVGFVWECLLRLVRRPGSARRTLAAIGSGSSRT